MQIECYGFEASSQWFRRKDLEVYLMKEVEGILYLWARYISHETIPCRGY